MLTTSGTNTTRFLEYISTLVFIIHFVLKLDTAHKFFTESVISFEFQFSQDRKFHFFIYSHMYHIIEMLSNHARGLISALLRFNETDYNYFITYTIINKAGLPN